jgi:hypothetical protein
MTACETSAELAELGARLKRENAGTPDLRRAFGARMAEVRAAEAEADAEQSAATDPAVREPGEDDEPYPDSRDAEAGQ